jgi:hypothetical protein
MLPLPKVPPNDKPAICSAQGKSSVGIPSRIPKTLMPYDRNIMYCSNDSNLYVNNVTTNGVRFGGHPDLSVTTKKLWVDANGDLRFGIGDINSDKYVSLSTTKPL